MGPFSMERSRGERFALVREWIELHHAELEVCWDRAVNHEPPGTIDPLP
jgi:hypothetical protein